MFECLSMNAACLFGIDFTTKAVELSGNVSTRYACASGLVQAEILGQQEPLEISRWTSFPLHWWRGRTHINDRPNW